MNVCIIGDGLTSLSLAKNLVNKKINVHIYHEEIINNLLTSRTIGISNNNLKFFKKEINKIPKNITWEIKKIEIYSEKFKKDKILDFGNNKDNLFYIVKNNELYDNLNKSLLKNKFFKKKKIKEKNFYNKLINKNSYDLIINCKQENPIFKKYFYKKIDKDYKNNAYTTILEHKKIENNSAIQTFTNEGPIAFLPISNTQTSVVFSVDNEKHNYDNNDILKLIKKYNTKFEIKKNSKLNSFKLRLSNLRNYYYRNILSFGDLLHRVHPLAGQGFNMTLRDIKILSEIIQDKIDCGLQLDSTILKEFETRTKRKNIIFSSGIDFIYEFFNLNKKLKGNNINKTLKFFGKNKKLVNLIIKFADNGLDV